MPRSTVKNVPVDDVLPLVGLAETLVRLAHEPALERRDAVTPEKESDIETETCVTEFGMAALETPRGCEPSVYSCPDCHGGLWEVQDGDLRRSRCRVGHAFSPETLLVTQSENLEDALWIGLHALEESAAPAGRRKDRAVEWGHVLVADRSGEQSQDAHQRAKIIREALVRGQIIAQSGPPAAEENTRSRRGQQ